MLLIYEIWVALIRSGILSADAWMLKINFAAFNHPYTPATLKNGGNFGKHNKWRSLSRHGLFVFITDTLMAMNGALQTKIASRNCWIPSIRILNFHYRYFHHIIWYEAFLSLPTSPKRFFVSRHSFLIFIFFSHSQSVSLLKVLLPWVFNAL